MGSHYFFRGDAIKLIDRYKKDVEKSTLLGEQLSCFDRQVLIDFIEWLYESERLEIVNRFKD